MTARELLETNGDMGSSSPLLQTARRFHTLCERLGISYAIVGGLAVVRNGTVRTTSDVDVLISHADWLLIAASHAGMTVDGDHAVDTETGVPVDALHPGDEWQMVIELPEPSQIAEYDEDLGASFASLPAILEIKTAVYLKKNAEDGDAVAAKDLSDIVSLIQHHGPATVTTLAATMAEPIARELMRITNQLSP